MSEPDGDAKMEFGGIQAWVSATSALQERPQGDERPALSVVIPVYRAAPVLPELHRRVVDALVSRVSSFEIVLVEDCGGDASWDVIETIAARDSRVRGIRLSRNFGQHNALLCGIRAARGEVIATIDDDLQNPPEEIPRLLQRLGADCDVVYGTPRAAQHGLLRNLASRATKVALQGAMGAETARSVSAFRVFKTHVRDAFTAYRSPTVNIDVLLTWSTTKFRSLEVRHDARQAGVSGYTLSKLLTHALNMMTGFSTLPLRVASLLGMAFAALGIVVLTYVVGRWLLEGSTVPGFAFLASIIAIFSGVQLFALGIFGEYLARMHFRTMERPAYSVLQTTARPGDRLASHEDRP